MEFFLGIDSGGTKTAFTLVNSKGDILDSFVLNGCYLLQEGKEKIKGTILGGVSRAKEKTNSENLTCFLGIPAYNDLEEVRNVCSEIALESGVKFFFDNDVICGHYGALVNSGGVGISIVAGTGSIAHGVNSLSNSKTIGGWGYQLFGDDGSAHHIARMAINEFEKQADGRHEKTALYYKLRDFLKLNVDDRSIYSVLIFAWQMQRDKIASISKIVGELLKENDSAAIKIIEKAANELVLHAHALKQQLSMADFSSVALIGSVKNAGEKLITPFKKGLKEAKLKYVESEFSAQLGACIIAAQKNGTPLSKEALTKLHKRSQSKEIDFNGI